jgi:GR25 family glycosyltransferase involved in LPS biosynthesis
MSILENCYTAYINLSHRKDRNEHMIEQLLKVGVYSERMPGLTPDLFPEQQYNKMRGKTPGAIGCMVCQMAVMHIALSKDKHAFVMEDDLVFCEDFHDRLRVFEGNVPGNWDILWLGGTFHKEPVWHGDGHLNKLPCTCTLSKDWEPTGHKNIVKTFGVWSTYAYIVNKTSIEKVLKGLEDLMPQTIGIDYSMIAMQPELNTYAFVPGMIKQMDNQSDIGKGITKFSGFEKLGPHWYADTYDTDKNYME